MTSTLNPNLLAKDTTDIIHEAVDLMSRYHKKNLFPEMALLSLIHANETAGGRLLQQLAANLNIDLTRLERQVRLAVESRRDLPGDLALVTRDNRTVELSRQMVIVLDEALSLAEARNEVWIGSNHLLIAMTQKTLGTASLLAQYGITPKAISDLVGGISTATPRQAPVAALDNRQCGSLAPAWMITKSAQ